jgi:2-dehydro-3-deoxyphosphogluconate aldolase/(4S)-4-hydroxy-2-oxoglutarate aldolase
MGIARGLSDDALIPAFRAALDGGVTHLEITMNTPGAADQIVEAIRWADGRVPVGAGTVLSVCDAEKALEAGASFIVCPQTDPGITAFCGKRNVPVYPGALTPTEVCNAWNAGAAMVKVFPVSSMGGPDYIRNLKGPFEKIPLLACGGVSPDNIAAYRKAGTDGIAVGGSLFRKEWLEKGEFGRITSYLRDMLAG